MSERKKIRVAAVGAGYFSRFQYAAWHRIAETELVGICNRSIAPAKELARQYNIAGVYSNFEQMLDDCKPDLVDIITPPETHAACVKAAVDRGLFAICQKPFTPKLEEAQRLVEYISSKKAKVVIHENFRFQPWYQQIKKLLEQGVLGEIYQISYRLRPGDGQGATAYMERQPYFQQMPRLLVHETAVHFIDVFRYLFGEVESVYADLRRLNPVLQGEDSGLIVLEFEKGKRGVFDGNRLSDHRAKNRRLTMGELLVEGENGSIFLNGDAQILLRMHGQNDEKNVQYDWIDNDFGGDCVFNLQQHVVDHLSMGSPLMNTAADYLSNLHIVEACYASNESGSKLRLADFKPGFALDSLSTE